MNSKAEHVSPSEEAILSMAVARAAALWGMTNEGLGDVLGVSAATASRLRSGNYLLPRGSKSFELGQYLVRMFRSLDAIMASDDAASMSWLQTENLDLAGRPLDLIRTVRGLTEVTHYLDDFRAHV